MVFLVVRMIPEKVFQQILALGEAWRVVRMDYQEKKQRVLIRVEEQPALWKQESCPHCGGKAVRGYDHAPERRWRHLNVCQLRSEIVCALPRGECQGCRKIYTVQAPWEGRSRGLLWLTTHYKRRGTIKKALVPKMALVVFLDYFGS